MRIERKLIKAARVLATKLFKTRSGTAQSRREPTTELHPCSLGTRLVVRRGNQSLSRIVTDEPIPQAVSLSSQWMQACQAARGEVEIILGEDTAEFRWDDGAFPASLRLSLMPAEELPAMPSLSAVDGRLFAAMAAASTAVDQGSLRYALHCIQLDGQRGTVTGTDGKQLIRFDGFTFPWNDRAILTPGSGLFGCAELRDLSTVACGTTDTELVIEASPWTFFLPLELDARYPNVEMVVSRYSKAINRVYFDPRDLKFFAANIRHIPGASVDFSPVTLDLNGHVDLAADGDEQSRPMRIRLSRSVHVGKAVCCSTDRKYLQQAAKLGLTELLRFGDTDPVVCRGENVIHLWQPLIGVTVPEDRQDTVRIDSAVGGLTAAG